MNPHLERDDIDRIRARDVRLVVEADLGAPRQRGTRHWAWRCPYHDDRGPSLMVREYHWKCFGCDEHGDAIDWVQRYHGLSFYEACIRLDSSLEGAVIATPTASKPSFGPPSESFQAAARKVAAIASEALWSPLGAQALNYLLVSRGLSEETIRAAQLGYVPGDVNGWQTLEGMLVPTGITLPWEVLGSLWCINVRRRTGTIKPKYQLASWADEQARSIDRSSQQGAMYWAQQVQPGMPVLLLEGEFDTLLAWDSLKHIVAPVTLGAASNFLHERWKYLFQRASVNLEALDADAAGHALEVRLKEHAKLFHLDMPHGKDLTDFYRQTSKPQLRAWITGSLWQAHQQGLH